MGDNTYIYPTFEGEPTDDARNTLNLLCKTNDSFLKRKEKKVINLLTIKKLSNVIIKCCPLIDYVQHITLYRHTTQFGYNPPVGFDLLEGNYHFLPIPKISKPLL